MAFIFIQIGLIAALVLFFVAAFGLAAGSTLFVAIGLIGVGVSAVTVIISLMFAITSNHAMH